ncbi:hypothetical protein THAOC_34633, partial [Thalassiosira oceanica]
MKRIHKNSRVPECDADPEPQPPADAAVVYPQDLVYERVDDELVDVAARPAEHVEGIPRRADAADPDDVGGRPCGPGGADEVPPGAAGGGVRLASQLGPEVGADLPDVVRPKERGEPGDVAGQEAQEAAAAVCGVLIRGTGRLMLAILLLLVVRHGRVDLEGRAVTARHCRARRSAALIVPRLRLSLSPPVPFVHATQTAKLRHSMGQALDAMDDSASGSKRKRDLRQDATAEVFFYEGGELALELGGRGDITSVRVGPRVEEIPCGTFRGCTNLTEVQFDEGALQVIGERAFQGCTTLRCVTIPPSVTKVGKRAFEYCGNLVEVHLNDGLRTIGERSFSHCEQLRSVTMPSTVTDMGADSFWSCHNLVEVQLNEGLQCIGARAFDGCTALRSVAIPSTVTELGVGLFDCCAKLAEVHFSEGMQIVRPGAFHGCTALQSVTIPSSITKLGDW